MNDEENLFKNVEEANQYVQSLNDPVAKGFCEALYLNILFKMSNVELVGGFDLLFLFKLVNEFVSDREQLQYLVSLDKQLPV